MSTFSQDPPNARAAQSDAPKDDATKEDIANAEGANTEGQVTIPQNDPQQPTNVVTESDDETADRHIASTELPASAVTPEETQSDTALAEDAGKMIVPGAAAGPEPDGTIRNDHGKPAYAPPGSLNAAFQGVQQDAAGHVDSVGTDNSSKSGTRV